MKILHMADVHLGCVPDGRSEWAQMRARELWETFRESIADADSQKVDLVLIAGDLFHATPTEAELREVNYVMGSYPDVCFALIHLFSYADWGAITPDYVLRFMATSLLGLTVHGCLLQLLKEKSGTIWLSVLLHAAMDYSVVLKF